MRADLHHASSDGLSKRPPEGPGQVSFSQVISLKRSGPEPLYYQLAQSIERAVESGAISHGTRLLSEKTMAEELNVAVSTVRNAWAYLERKGLLTRARQAGTFVR